MRVRRLEVEHISTARIFVEFKISIIEAKLIKRLNYASNRAAFHIQSE
jgi:hypothetical protein